jgi:hypothetical protein
VIVLVLPPVISPAVSTSTRSPKALPLSGNELFFASLYVWTKRGKSGVSVNFQSCGFDAVDD